MRTIKRCLWNKEKPLRLKTGSLSERDILTLNETFLTNGFHDIQVTNFAYGRKLLWQFLSLLKCYNNVACLSIDFNSVVEKDIFNLYSYLEENNLFYDEQAINEFLLNEFAFDFLWIEWSKKLEGQPWFAVFKHKLIEFDLEKEIPIVILHVQASYA